MKKKDIFGVVPTYWKTTDLENLFDIRQDSRGLFIFNLNESMYLLIPDQACLFYTCQYAEMHWPLISYMIYGTTRLAWLLMKLNNVSVDAMFMPKYASEKVKYIDKSYLQQIVKTINGYE